MKCVCIHVAIFDLVHDVETVQAYAICLQLLEIFFEVCVMLGKLHTSYFWASLIFHT